ncbi:MAG: recombinase family protein [Rhodocyclaceae bacterium]|nr:recombinase family protein [Rhodocyclaceae bacterium]
MDAAALYLRSSKDRHDVSLDAQRRELLDLARQRGLVIAETFQDAVESGKDDQRPGFQALLRTLKSPARTWNHLLALDTSRIARNQYLAHALHYECEKRNIKILYAKVPETGGVMDVVIRAVMQAFDQLHSLMSKEKGLGGMAENVRQGWRAGGRAPTGYKLEHVATGAMRDGEAVTKSRLVLGDDASRVKRYMEARAAGIGRVMAIEQSGLSGISDTTLIGMEWNSLTYAGHTVWNVHAEKLPGGGYKGGTKRRPRVEWVIQYDTHPAMISTEEAEVILSRMDSGRPKKYRTKADYILSGLLVTPDGKAWHGDGEGFYRAGKGRRTPQAALEMAVMDRLSQDLVSDEFIADLVANARKSGKPPTDDSAKPLRAQIDGLTTRISRLTDMASESDTPRPFMAQITELERQRESLVGELNRLEEEQRSAEVFRAIRDKDVRALLGAVATSMEHLDRESLKEVVRSVLESIELCPTTLSCRLHYRIAAGDLVASPRGFEPRFIP